MNFTPIKVSELNPIFLINFIIYVHRLHRLDTYSTRTKLLKLTGNIKKNLKLSNLELTILNFILNDRH